MWGGVFEKSFRGLGILPISQTVVRVYSYVILIRRLTARHFFEGE